MEHSISSNIIDFWFSPENSKKWFTQNTIFDKTVYDSFNKVLEEKRKVILDEPKTNDKTYLIDNIILFDQISRNIERFNGHTFREEDDFIALNLAYHFISTYDVDIEQKYFYFVILPLRHTKLEQHCKKAIYLIKEFEQKNKVSILLDTTTWGKEGEIDFCIKLTGLSIELQQQFIQSTKDKTKDSKLVRLYENTVCKYKK